MISLWTCFRSVPDHLQSFATKTNALCSVPLNGFLFVSLGFSSLGPRNTSYWSNILSGFVINGPLLPPLWTSISFEFVSLICPHHRQAHLNRWEHKRSPTCLLEFFGFSGLATLLSIPYTSPDSLRLMSPYSVYQRSPTL